jgi:hypothetical protein
MALSGVMGRKRMKGNHSPQKNDSIQDSVESGENGHPILDLNKTIINGTKKPSKNKHWKTSQKIHEEELDMGNQNVHDALKKFQDTHTHTHKRTWEDTETNNGTQRGLQQTPK